MPSLKALLTSLLLMWLSLLLLAINRHINSPAALETVTTAQPLNITLPAALEKREGYGWLENTRGTEAYRCEYWTNPLFDKIHLAGRNSTHSEREIKRAAKHAGAVTGWKWKDLGHGSFDVRVSLSCRALELGWFANHFCLFFLVVQFACTGS
jgi:hypothetical protein